MRSKILLQIKIKEMGAWIFRHCLSRFLCFFQSEQNIPSFRQSLKIVYSGLQIEFFT